MLQIFNTDMSTPLPMHKVNRGLSLTGLSVDLNQVIWLSQMPHQVLLASKIL